MATQGCRCTTEGGQSGSPELCPSTSFQTEEGNICDWFTLAGTDGSLFACMFGFFLPVKSLMTLLLLCSALMGNATFSHS